MRSVRKFSQIYDSDFYFDIFCLVVITECPPKYNGKCFRNGNDVLKSLSYRTQFTDVLLDYAGLIILGVIMHIFAYLFIRRNIRGVGYY